MMRAPMRISVPVVRSALVILVCTTALTGCQTASGPRLTSYRDASDPCVSYREPLIATEVDLQTWTLVGAVGGAAAGAGLGALLSGGDVKGIVGGALAGGLAGGTAGYLGARRQQTTNQEELIRGIENDAASDSRLVAQVTSAVAGLGECRRLEIATVREQVEEGSISSDLARAKADAVQARIDDDNELISAVLGRVDERLGVYADAKSEVLGETGAAPAPAVELPREEPVVVPVDIEEIAPAAGIYVAQRRADVRSQPTTQSEVAGVLDAGERINVTGRTQDGQWLAFSRQSQPAFVQASLVSEYVPESEVERLAVEREKMRSAQEVASVRTEHELEALEALI